MKPTYFQQQLLLRAVQQRQNFMSKCEALTLATSILTRKAAMTPRHAQMLPQVQLQIPKLQPSSQLQLKLHKKLQMLMQM